MKLIDRVVVIATDTGSIVEYKTRLELMITAKKDNPKRPVKDLSTAIELLYGDCVNWQEMESDFTIEVSSNAALIMPT